MYSLCKHSKHTSIGGSDPFNQNFRKSRSKTQWIGSDQSEKLLKSGPPFKVDLFSRLDRSDRNGPFHLTIPTHSQSQDLAVRYLPCTKWRKILITALLWIVGCWRLLKTIYFPKEFSSFDSKPSNVVFEVTWQISGNGPLKITCYTG